MACRWPPVFHTSTDRLVDVLFSHSLISSYITFSPSIHLMSLALLLSSQKAMSHHLSISLKKSSPPPVEIGQLRLAAFRLRRTHQNLDLLEERGFANHVPIYCSDISPGSGGFTDSFHREYTLKNQEGILFGHRQILQLLSVFQVHLAGKMAGHWAGHILKPREVASDLTGPYTGTYGIVELERCVWSSRIITREMLSLRSKSHHFLPAPCNTPLEAFGDLKVSGGDLLGPGTFKHLTISYLEICTSSSPHFACLQCLTRLVGAAMTLKSGGTFPLHHRFCSESPNCFTSALRTLIEKTFWIVLDSQGG